MTIEAGLTQLQVDVAELADESQRLAKSVTSSLAEIDAVKGDIQNTHNFVDSNYQAMNDWQTKHGTVTFKNLQGQNKQVNTLSKLILDSEKINPNPHVMSKAQFDALRELRKQQYAGSGFVEWGKHSKLLDEVSQGLWTYTGSSWKNKFALGISSSVKAGNSKTDYPRVVVDGVQHSLEHISSNRAGEHNYINFPEAPDGTKTYDSATGVVTEHASAAEAFNERKDTSPTLTSSVIWDTGINTLSFTAPSLGGASFPTGKPTGNSKFILIIESSENSVIQLRDSVSTSGSAPLIATKNVLAGKITRLEGAYTAANTGIYIRVTNVQAGQTIKIHSFQVLTSTESVITSRKDLVFLETWHEKISDKDVVYPLGNVQYGGTTFDGMTMDLSPSGIAHGYSAFGEWDTATNGRGHRWTTLIDSEKKKFIDNPENNIYYDSEADELIQVRYRVRVVEGLGDDWQEYRPTENNKYGLCYSYNNCWINSQNASEVSLDFTREFVNNVYWSPAGFNGKHLTTNGEVSAFEARHTVNGHGAFAVPIALVQRMNQGAYHPTYNPMGCNTFAISGGGHYSWFGTFNSGLGDPFDLVNSTSQCFIKYSDKVGASGEALGKIGTNSGRSDQYKYYDAIYAGQVEDLRLNANKLDVNQLREESMRKAVAGEMRGKGKVPFTFVMPLKQSTTGLVNQGWVCFIGPDSPINFYTHPVTKSIPRTAGVPNTSGLSTVGSFKVGGAVYTFDEVRLHATGHQYIYFKLTAGTLGSTSKKTKVIFSLQDSYKSTSEFESLPWVDIIGDPERIATTFPDGVVGQWVRQVPDGTNKLYSLSEKANSELQTQWTDDDGLTWNSGILSTDFVSNGRAANIPIGRVQLFNYETSSNFTERSNNSVVVGDVGDVHFTTHSNPAEGNRLQGSLTGGIGKANADPAQTFAPNLGEYKFLSSGEFSEYNQYSVKTGEVPLAGQGNDSPAVKSLSTITEKDGLLYLQLHGAELKHQPLGAMHTINAGVAFDYTKGELAILQGFDNASFNVPVIFLNDKAMTLSKTYFNRATIKSDGTIVWQSGLVDKNLRVVTSSTAWGDDQVIPIVNGEDVKTDLNGNTVKVFCHHTQIPLGIASN